MGGGRFGVVCLLVIGGVAACRTAPPPLPPIPASSGLVLVKPGEAPEAHDGQIVIDRVVAVVNDEIIMMSELQEAMALYQREAKGVQQARREKVEITDDDVKAAVDGFVRRNGGDRGQIEGQLKAQGITWDGLRREIRDQLMAQKIRGRRVSRRAHVTEPEVDAYIAENRAKLEAGLKYHARHIIVLAEPNDQPGAWERAEAEIGAIRGLLREGADFAVLARERSKDPSAPTGGDLGWLARGELERVFEEPLLRLSKGGVTEPIKSGAGYHLFKLEDVEGLNPEMLADARQQAREILLQRKAQERLDEWLDELRRRALIAVRL